MYDNDKLNECDHDCAHCPFVCPSNNSGDDKKEDDDKE